jgi:hypothetical protein
VSDNQAHEVKKVLSEPFDLEAELWEQLNAKLRMAERHERQTSLQEFGF